MNVEISVLLYLFNFELAIGLGHHPRDRSTFTFAAMTVLNQSVYSWQGLSF